jgi:hypothetical protein
MNDIQDRLREAIEHPAEIPTNGHVDRIGSEGLKADIRRSFSEDVLIYVVSSTKGRTPTPWR